MSNILFYVTTVLIWGSTWLAIKFQLGSVDPMVSVAYRFGLAAALLLCYCRLAGLRMRFSLQEHLFIALQGALLFAVNYWLFYLAETTLASGLVAVVFATIVVMNIVNGALLLKSSLDPLVLLGAAFGLGGIALVFLPELGSFSLTDHGFTGLLLCLAATFLASLGNIVSARNQQRRLPVLQTNAFGMAYGSLLMSLFALFAGVPFGFEATLGYVASLLYLAVFGSIVAFGCYLTLVGRIGADRAAYATLLFPLVALGISAIFEGYRFTPLAIAGTALILAGNVIMLRKRAAPA